MGSFGDGLKGRRLGLSSPTFRDLVAWLKAKQDTWMHLLQRECSQLPKDVVSRVSKRFVQKLSQFAY